jgi:SAM-dependent methyltransferase
MGRSDGARWNHNIHFHRVVLDAVRPGATSALDVGTGDGMLAVELRRRVREVVAVDTDAAVLGRAAGAARAHDVPDGIRWVHADVMTHDFGRRFDVVASIATVHHLPDLRAALRRLAELTAPGGVLVIVGLARAATLGDHARGLAGAVQHRWYARTRTLWEHTAPTVWPPPHTYAEVRAAGAEVLPGARWRHHALWRYTLIWERGR